MCFNKELYYKLLHINIAYKNIKNYLQIIAMITIDSIFVIKFFPNRPTHEILLALPVLIIYCFTYIKHNVRLQILMYI